MQIESLNDIIQRTIRSKTEVDQRIAHDDFERFAAANDVPMNCAQLLTTVLPDDVRVSATALIKQTVKSGPNSEGKLFAMKILINQVASTHSTAILRTSAQALERCCNCVDFSIYAALIAEIAELIQSEQLSSEVAIQLLVATLERRTRSAKALPQADTAIEAVIFPFLLQTAVESKQSLKMLGQQFRNPVPMHSNYVQQSVQQAMKSKFPLEIIDLFIILMRYSVRCRNLIPIKRAEQQHQAYLSSMDSTFPEMFQFVLNLLQTEKDDVLARAFTYLRLVFDSPLALQLNDELAKQLLEFSESALKRHVEQTVSAEDIQPLDQPLFQTDTDIALFTALHPVSYDEFDAADAIMQFWTAYNRKQILSELVAQAHQTFIQLTEAQDPTQYYVKTAQIVTSMNAVDYLVRQENISSQPPAEVLQLLQSIIEFFTGNLTFERQPLVVNISVWALRELLDIQNGFETVIHCINHLSAMVGSARTQSEFYTMIKFIIHGFDRIKANELSKNLPQLTGQLEPAIIESSLQLLLTQQSDFCYYPEITDYVTIACEELSKVDSEYVSLVFGNFFRQYTTLQNIKLAQLVDVMKIFGRIFVFKEAEVEEGLYAVYLEVITDTMLHVLHSYQPESYSDLESVCQSAEYLLANASSIDNFQESEHQLSRLFTNLIQFIVAQGDAVVYLTGATLLALTDVYWINEASDQLVEYVLQAVQQLSDEQQMTQNLCYVARIIVAHGLRKQLSEAELEAILTVLLQPSDLRKVDVTPDELYTSIYYLLCRLSIQSNVDVLGVDSKPMRQLRAYLPAHLYRITDRGCLTTSFIECVQEYCVENYCELQNVIEKLTYRTNIEQEEQIFENRGAAAMDIPEIISDRPTREERENEVELFEMRGRMHKTKLLSQVVREISKVPME